MNRAERNRERTRDRLYEVAVSLFIERGYEATTMSDIAERADVARGTVFNHFLSKSAFTMEWAARRRRDAEHAARTAAGPQATLADQLRAYFRELAVISVKYPELTIAMVHGWLSARGPVVEDPWLTGDLLSWIEEGQRLGELIASVQPVVAADLLRDAYLGVIYRWIRDTEHGRDTDLPGSMATVIDLVLSVLIRHHER